MIGKFLLVLLFLLNVGGVWAADVVQTPRVKLQLIIDDSSVTPASTLWVGLYFDLIPGWHLYWRNPGDSGTSPKVSWQLPAGWQAGEIQWPTPKRITVGSLTNYGYEKQVTLIVPLSVSTRADSLDTVRIGADVSWLVCHEVCIPEKGRLDLQLPLSGQTSVTAIRHRDKFENARSQLPISFNGMARYRIIDDNSLRLKLDRTGWLGKRIKELWFASQAWGEVAASGTQQWEFTGEDLVLKLPVGELSLTTGDSLQGLLVLTEQTDNGELTHSFSIDAMHDDKLSVSPNTTFQLAIFMAVLGGILLNLMPCVLPVLSIKTLSLIQTAGRDSARHGIVFLCGVMLSFAALAGLLIVLRASGTALGWGFQLQEPVIVISIMYLMLAIALNLSGVFSVGDGMIGVGQGLTERQTFVGTLATGVLAVVVATPCTAPFMATAVGFALTLKAGEATLVFLALGFGFALPMLVLSISPRLLRLLPRPGAWMERLRNALAFPMYATAAWLLWVLSQQVTAQILAAALLGAVFLAFALWCYGQPFSKRWRYGILFTTAIGLVIGVVAVTGSNPTRYESWSLERVRQLQQQGRAILVNFTAAWCITCKVNEQVALSSEKVSAALSRQNIAYLRGDWTQRDPAITNELQRHGRSGVPLYLLYSAGSEHPQVLPQILTERMVLKAIQNIELKE